MKNQGNSNESIVIEDLTVANAEEVKGGDTSLAVTNGGSDSTNVVRHRMFAIIDRTQQN